MPLDKETKKPLGFAYMLFMMPEHAVRALEDLDGSIFQVGAHTVSKIQDGDRKLQCFYGL